MEGSKTLRVCCGDSLEEELKRRKEEGGEGAESEEEESEEEESEEDELEEEDIGG